MHPQTVVGLSALVGLAFGLQVGETTDMPGAPQLGLVLGGLLGWAAVGRSTVTPCTSSLAGYLLSSENRGMARRAQVRLWQASKATGARTASRRAPAGRRPRHS